MEKLSHMTLNDLLLERKLVLTYSPAGRQLPSQTKRHLCIVAINGKDPITNQVVLDELNHNQTPQGKSNIKISLCRSKSYQRTDIEKIALNLI